MNEESSNHSTVSEYLTPFNPDLWYSGDQLKVFGISDGRLREWRRKRGLAAVNLKKMIYYGKDIHHILLELRE